MRGKASRDEIDNMPDQVKKHAIPKLTHVRHDPVHCLAAGLFRSLRKGQRSAEKLEVVYEFGDGQRVEFSGPEPQGFRTRAA